MKKFNVGTPVVCTFGDNEVMGTVVHSSIDGVHVVVELEEKQSNRKYMKMKLKAVKHTDEMDELSSDEYLDLMILARSLKCTDLYYSFRNKLNKKAIR